MIGMPDREQARILRLATPSTRSLTPAVLFGIAWALSAMALLATSAYLITAASLTIHMLLLQSLIASVRGFAIGRSVFRYVERLLGHSVSFRQLAKLRAGVYERLEAVVPAGLGAAGRGELLDRLVTDVDGLQYLPLRVIEPLVVSLVSLLLAVSCVCLVNLPAGAALAASLVIAAIVALLVHERLGGDAERRLARERGELGQSVDEFLRGLDTLEAFGAVAERRATIAELDRALCRSRLRSTLGEGAVQAVMILCSGLASAAALIFGSDALATGNLTPPLLTLIVLVPMACFEVFQAVPLAAGAWRQLRPSAGRIAELAQETPPTEIPSARTAPDGPSPWVRHHTPTLELREVRAHWPGAAKAQLEVPALTLAPGTRLLVRGPSGSGKSTLAAVLVRFLEHEGSYLLDGIDVKSTHPDHVRAVVGLIEQRPHLFHETIRQNLLFAKPDASDAELISSLERVGLGSWLRSRGGLDTRVGEQGTLLSGGQAHRIALARAILADFPILVLDEPTADVDPPRAEALVRELVEAAGPERTVIIISHTPIASQLVTQELRLGA
ncbi:thiol reductant ABC exporter subunit CydC [Pseudoclavibacter albus]|uniref:thiol reductant ABC exporter subunit CydC n=1 Tax=Pseudoclavibacter albus TaxID=272241 RepID=UPI001F153532|nr:thiol reductant ABC exporter subunit CydC [Pseudoclavibacter alba]